MSWDSQGDVPGHAEPSDREPRVEQEETEDGNHLSCFVAGLLDIVQPGKDGHGGRLCGRRPEHQGSSTNPLDDEDGDEAG